MAKTTLSSKILSQDRNKFAEIAVKAILRQGDVCICILFVIFTFFWIYFRMLILIKLALSKKLVVH
jgi:hypothetical protein